MWRTDQSLRTLVEDESHPNNGDRRLTKRNVTNESENDLSVITGEYQRDNDKLDSSNEVNWYDRFCELYSATTRARTILSIGLIVINVLVAIYVLLMYTFASSSVSSSVSSESSSTTYHGTTRRKSGDNCGSIWRTAGLVTILNGIPVVTAINLLAEKK